MLATKQQKRVTFKNILFATDFSEAANQAVPFAAGLARSFESNLYVLHVAEPVNYVLPPEAWQSTEAADEAALSSLKETVQKSFPELKPQVLEVEGDVPRAVEDAVRNYEIDLLVLGTRGRTGIGKALMGSRAEAILRRVSCPVLTVGPNLKSNGRGKMATILFATNFGPSSLAAAPIAVSLAEEYQSKLLLLHVEDYLEVEEQRGEFGESSQNRLRALFPDDAELWCQPHLLVEQGEPGEAILKAAERSGADLIVLGVHGPEGVPGAATHLPYATVHKVVSRAACPVLTANAR